MKTKWHKQNIFKSVVTSILGVALICFGGFLMFKVIDAQGWEHTATLIGEGLSLIGFGLYLLGIEDPRFPKRGSGGSAVVIIVVAVLLASCTTWNKCARKFGTGAMHTITLRDTVKVYFQLPPDSASGTVPCDELKAGDTITHVSESGDIEVQFWRDKYDSATGVKPTIRYKTVYKPKEIIKEVPVEVQGDCPDAVVVNPEQGATRLEKFWKEFQFFSAIVLLAGLLLILVYLFIKRR